jgi:predicted XRE-type DNA-binding protein
LRVWDDSGTYRVIYLGRKQVEAAERCGVTQPRINDLLLGRVSRFSLDALVNIATALGRRCVARPLTRLRANAA